MNSDDNYVDIVKTMMMMKWCLCDDDQDCDVDDLKMLLMLLWFYEDDNLVMMII